MLPPSKIERPSWNPPPKPRFSLWTLITCLIWDSCHQSWGRVVYSKFSSSRWCSTSTARINMSSKKIIWMSLHSKGRVHTSTRTTRKRIWYKGIPTGWDTVKRLFKEGSSSSSNPSSLCLVQILKLRTSSWYMRLRTITQTLYLKINISKHWIRQNLSSIFLMVDGYVHSAKTTTFMEELSAIDAKKLNRSQILMVSQSICSKRMMEHQISLLKQNLYRQHLLTQTIAESFISILNFMGSSFINRQRTSNHRSTNHSSSVIKRTTLIFKTLLTILSCQSSSNWNSFLFTILKTTVIQVTITIYNNSSSIK